MHLAACSKPEARPPDTNILYQLPQPTETQSFMTLYWNSWDYGSGIWNPRHFSSTDIVSRFTAVYNKSVASLDWSVGLWHLWTDGFWSMALWSCWDRVHGLFCPPSPRFLSSASTSSSQLPSPQTVWGKADYHAFYVGWLTTNDCGGHLVG